MGGRSLYLVDALGDEDVHEALVLDNLGLVDVGDRDLVQRDEVVLDREGLLGEGRGAVEHAFDGLGHAVEEGIDDLGVARDNPRV